MKAGRAGPPGEVCLRRGAGSARRASWSAVGLVIVLGVGAPMGLAFGGAAAALSGPADEPGPPVGAEGEDAAGPGIGPPAASAGEQTATEPSSELVPPRLLRDSPASYPASLDPSVVNGEVWLQLVIGPEGSVTAVEVTRGVHPLLDSAALEAARGLGFEPATLAGQPIAVVIEFSYRFLAPPPPTESPDPAATTGVIKGEVRARGSRRPVPGAALVLAEGQVVLADAEGRFELELPAGTQQVRVSAAGFREGSFEETVEASMLVEVVYVIEPVLVNPYETIVLGERERREVSRVSLRNQELREVPGTMGDPFRVVMTLPGVGGVMSGVAYPVVRGSSPASTGYFLDGIRVPILFHLFLGPAVVHPDFVQGIDFFPGAPPPRFGRLLGGVIDGKISRPQDGRLHATAYADLLNAGGFVEYPFQSTGTSVTLAGRFSYTPWLIALAANSTEPSSGTGRPSPRLVMEFWDYQGRVEQRLGGGRLRLLAFGSSDLFGTESNDPRVSTGTQAVLFHRGDLRYQHPLVDGELEVGLTLGLDRLAFGSSNASQLSTAFGMDERSYRGRASWQGEVGERLQLTVGGDLDRREARVRMEGYASAFSDVRLSIDEPKASALLAGVWGELVWKSASGAWSIVPGVRVDNYHLVPRINHLVAEPRLTVRRSVSEALVLKGAAGLYHQQPTTLIQLPVVDFAGLQHGIQRALQFDLGFEWKVPLGFELNADVYLNPLLRTLEMNPFDASALSRGTPAQSGLFTLPDGSELLGGEQVASHGSAYGFELMLRRAMGGRWFGWISYGLQRSTRWASFQRFDEHGEFAGAYAGYLPYVFDQTHLLNGVLSVKLGSWTLGGGVHFNTGRPESGVMTSATMRQGVDPNGRPAWLQVDGDRVGRLPSFFRLDMRVARTWAFDDFLLDAYVDVLNVTLSREVVAYTYLGGLWNGGGPMRRLGEGVPVILPMLGVKGSY